jgi:predicted 3-demethylubiquinone-9 3-methyltransferase (glyoxalase superfamily)
MRAGRRKTFLAGPRIATCLWFDSEAEEAVKHYMSIFPNSRILRTMRYGEAGKEIHGKPAGSILTIEFELDGQRLVALNGGPVFKFNEAMSLIVRCKDQREVDYYWKRLGRGGDPNAQMCGWLKDKFGVSWQVEPVEIEAMLANTDRKRADRAMEALLKMKKLEVAAIRRAFEGG